jgi:lactate dehydrogenase-like 2-hydroxyacid dehydrogenase
MTQPPLAKAFLCRRLTTAVEAALHQRFDLTLNTSDSRLAPAEIAERAVGAHALFVTATETVNAELMQRLQPTLKIVATLSVGHDHIDLPAAKALGIRVLNTPDVLSDACAEVAMMLVLNACRAAASGRAGHPRNCWVRDWWAGGSEFSVWDASAGRLPCVPVASD